MKNVNNDVNHYRKWMAVFLVFSMIATLCMPVYSKAQDAPAETVPEGYIGIYDIADLYAIRNDLSANYILMKDIDMSEDTAEGGDWNLTGHGWTPIDGFAGTFDGNGHRIIGMHIYGEMKQSVGLFGNSTVSNDRNIIIRNLAMVDVQIDVNMKGSSSLDAVGSIIGCVNGSGYGENIVEQCYASGNINVSGMCYGIGGLVGQGHSMRCNNVYNICNITSEKYDSIGGIMGQQYYASVFRNCYNIGVISSAGNGEIYPIVGHDYQTSNCYTLSETVNAENPGCTVLFPTQLKDQRTLVGFDFDNVWEIDPYCDYPYPQLKSNRQIRIVSMDIVTEPTKREYEQGDSLDLTGGTVKITYEDETTATIPIKEDMVSGYNMNLTGQQKVTVSYCNISMTYPITVKEVPLRGISLNQSKVSLERNKSLQLSVNYTPVNASNKTIEWTSSDPSIAKVDSNGLVTAKNKGTATITATSANGLVAQCQIEVLIPSATNTPDNTGNIGIEKGKNASVITSVKGRISSIKSTGSNSIKLKLDNLGSADGYQIQYSLKKNFKNAKMFKKKSTNITIKKLVKNKRYYVRVRVYGEINGKTYYGKWSAKKSIKTKRR